MLLNVVSVFFIPVLFLSLGYVLLSLGSVLLSLGFVLLSLGAVLCVLGSILLRFRKSISIFVCLLYFRFCPLVLINKRTNISVPTISISTFVELRPDMVSTVTSTRASGGFFSSNPSSSRRRCPGITLRAGTTFN